MDVKNLSSVIGRLKPFIRDQTIKRSRFDRALAAIKIFDLEVRLEIEQLLLDAGFTIEDDAQPVVPVDKNQQGAIPVGKPPAKAEQKSSEIPSGDPNSFAIAAARRRIERDRYTRDPAKVLLRPEEEVGLALLVRGESGQPIEAGGFARLEGEAQLAARCLLLHNQRLVRWVAKNYAPPGMEYEDLFQYGVIGLVRAVELFDPAQGTKFSTYAMNWIRQRITRGIADESRLIRVPVYMTERITKVWAARSRLTRDGRPPGLHELALECDLTDEQVTECLKLGPHHVTSLDTPVRSDSEATLGEILDRKESDSRPENEVELRMLRQLIDDVLDTLDEREARIMRLRYGLMDGEQWTLDQIGAEFGLSRERIRQIETATLTKLREPGLSSNLELFA